MSIVLQLPERMAMSRKLVKMGERKHTQVGSRFGVKVDLGSMVKAVFPRPRPWRQMASDPHPCHPSFNSQARSCHEVRAWRVSSVHSVEDTTSRSARLTGRGSQSRTLRHPRPKRERRRTLTAEDENFRKAWRFPGIFATVMFCSCKMPRSPQAKEAQMR